MPFPMGKGALSLGVKRLGREANSSPSSVEITNEWSYTSIPPMWLQGMQRDDFTLHHYINK